MLKPIDIKSQKFKKTIFGYKGADVDSFMDSVYRAYDDIYKKNDDLTSDLDKLNTSLKECRLKIFDLETKLQEAENVPSDDDVAAKKKADQIIKNAEAAAAQIIAKAKEQSEKIENANTGKTAEAKSVEEPKKTDDVKESASSKFFKHADETTHTVSDDEDDDGIFVGEIEDARKPDRMMIGDGEEEEDMDFEFL